MTDRLTEFTAIPHEGGSGARFHIRIVTPAEGGAGRVEIITQGDSIWIEIDHWNRLRDAIDAGLHYHLGLGAHLAKAARDSGGA